MNINDNERPCLWLPPLPVLASQKHAMRVSHLATHPAIAMTEAGNRLHHLKKRHSLDSMEFSVGSQETLLPSLTSRSSPPRF